MSATLLIFLSRNRFKKNYINIIDLGGNSGYHTCFFATFSPDINVITVEPNPEILGILKHNIQQNNLTNVELIECAVSDKENELTLYSSHTDSGTTSLNKLENYDSEYKVPVRTLDSLLVDREDYFPDLIKADLQGFDLHAINGSRQLIQKSFPDIILEFCPNEMPLSVEELTDIFRFLAKNKYNPFIFRAHDIACVEVLDFSVLLQIFDMYKKNGLGGQFNLFFSSSHRKIAS